MADEKTPEKNPDIANSFSDVPAPPATMDNIDYSPPTLIFGQPRAPFSQDLSELTVVEKMHLEAKLLQWDEPEIRKNAADSLVKLAEDIDTSLPTICRIGDILSFQNKCLGGKELSSQVRKLKKIVRKRVSAQEAEDVFETRKTLPYPSPPQKIAQPAICPGGPAKAPIKK